MAEYDKFAAQYDFWIQKVGDPNRYKRYLNFLPARNERALDVGCGSGWLTLHLSDYFERMVGIDISSAMIGLARQYCAEAQKDNIEFCIADMERLPFKERSYDFIVSDFSLHDVRLNRVLPILRRLIRHGGRIILRDLTLPSHRPRRSFIVEHTADALKNAKTFLRAGEFQTAWRLISFKMSSAWIRHEFQNPLLPPGQLETIYRRFLPGCRFEQWGDIFTVWWEAPEKPRVVHALARRQKTMVPVHPPGLTDQSRIDFDKEDINTSIPQRFAYIVNKYPEATAVKYGPVVMTYRELDMASNQAARAIAEQSGSNEDPVGLLLEHGIAPVIAILGILKAGRIYFALDPSHPENRLISILKDAGAKLLVNNAETAGLAAKLTRKSIRPIDLDQLDSRFSKERIDITTSAESLAAIFYTSGSTGRPKGVLRNHRTIMHSTWNNTHNYGVTPADRHSFLFFSGFSASVPDIYDTLLNGATLCPYPIQKFGLAQFADWLIEEKITLLQPPVTFFREFLHSVSMKKQFPELRFAILSGQSVYRQDVELFHMHFQACSSMILNYASTEAGLIGIFPIDRQSELPEGRLPAGYPVSGKEILLLDAKGQPVTDGQAGQIAVRSQFLSSEYWRQPDLTRKKFLPDYQTANSQIFLTGDLGLLRPDGCLEHLGRDDLQAKIRGYRIELAEIEAALHRFDFVREAAAIVKGEPEDPFIVAYWIPSSSSYPENGKLREMLADHLPAYMIPSRFVVLEKMPMTSTNKIDRQRLPDPGRTRGHLTNRYVPGNDSLELRLTEIWQEVFRIAPIGVNDNFFDLGGDSIRGLRLAAKIEEKLDRKFSTVTLWRAPTIAEQAAVLRNGRNDEPGGSVVPIQPNGEHPPIFYIPPAASTLIGAHALVEHLGQDLPFFGLQPKGIDNDVPPHTRIETMAADFIRNIRQIQMEGPYYLAGMCFGGIVAFEMAQQLLRQGQKVALLAILDTLFPPGSHATPKQQMRADSLYQRYQKIYRNYTQRLSKQLATQPQALPRTILISLKRKLFLMGPQGHRIRRVWKANHKARKEYAPQSYPGKITLFCSESHAPQRDDWRALSSQPIEIFHVAGTHRTMLDEPNVRKVVEKLRNCIKKAGQNVPNLN